MRRLAIFLTLLIPAVACQRSSDSEKKKSDPAAAATAGSGSQGSAAAAAGAAQGRPKVQQIKPPLDLAKPPADAAKTAGGVTYKKTVTNDAGTVAKKNDTVMINFTIWKPSTGETVATNRAADGTAARQMPFSLASGVPAFSEALAVLKKGEKAVFWMPAELLQRGGQPAGSESEVYEFEVVEIEAAPPVPADLKAAPANAQTLKSGAKYIVVRPGTGKDKPKNYDNVTYHATAWDSDGRMFYSTEARKRPQSEQPSRQAGPLEELLTSMTAGQRVRMWVDAEKLAVNGKPLPGNTKGLVTYEVEITQIAAGKPPPAPPADVAKPPADAKKSPKGVSYKILKPGPGGAKPKSTDTVRVHYTGWTTDGKMFDSSVQRGQPAEFPLGGVIPGWTDGIPMMSVGDKARFWIPQDLAYKGAPGAPQGMLVFDVELLEIKAPKDPHSAGDAHGDDDGHGHGAAAKPQIAAPADVAKAPADAKKSPKGVPYKVIKAGKGGPKPTADDTVRVHYTGWTTDGKMFDSSVQRGEPAEFPLRGVIAGWTDAIPVMSVGDTVRFWIPEDLAYKGQAGRPQGTLVFDVELIEIKSK